MWSASVEKYISRADNSLFDNVSALSQYPLDQTEEPEKSYEEIEREIEWTYRRNRNRLRRQRKREHSPAWARGQISQEIYHPWTPNSDLLSSTLRSLHQTNVAAIVNAGGAAACHETCLTQPTISPLTLDALAIDEKSKQCEHGPALVALSIMYNDDKAFEWLMSRLSPPGPSWNNDQSSSWALAYRRPRMLTEMLAKGWEPPGRREIFFSAVRNCHVDLAEQLFPTDLTGFRGCVRSQLDYHQRSQTMFDSGYPMEVFEMFKWLVGRIRLCEDELWQDTWYRVRVNSRQACVDKLRSELLSYLYPELLVQIMKPTWPFDKNRPHQLTARWQTRASLEIAVSCGVDTLPYPDYEKGWHKGAWVLTQYGKRWVSAQVVEVLSSPHRLLPLAADHGGCLRVCISNSDVKVIRRARSVVEYNEANWELLERRRGFCCCGRSLCRSSVDVCSATCVGQGHACRVTRQHGALGRGHVLYEELTRKYEQEAAYERGLHFKHMREGLLSFLRSDLLPPLVSLVEEYLGGLQLLVPSVHCALVISQLSSHISCASIWRNVNEFFTGLVEVRLFPSRGAHCSTAVVLFSDLPSLWRAVLRWWRFAERHPHFATANLRRSGGSGRRLVELQLASESALARAFLSMRANLKTVLSLCLPYEPLCGHVLPSYPPSLLAPLSSVWGLSSSSSSSSHETKRGSCDMAQEDFADLEAACLQMTPTPVDVCDLILSYYVFDWGRYQMERNRRMKEAITREQVIRHARQRAQRPSIMRSSSPKIRLRSKKSSGIDSRAMRFVVSGSAL